MVIRYFLDANRAGTTSRGARTVTGLMLHLSSYEELSLML